MLLVFQTIHPYILQKHLLSLKQLMYKRDSSQNCLDRKRKLNHLAKLSSFTD